LRRDAPTAMWFGHPVDGGRSPAGEDFWRVGRTAFPCSRLSFRCNSVETYKGCAEAEARVRGGQ